LIVQYLAVKSFQVNFTVRIIGYHTCTLTRTKCRNFRGWYRWFQLFGSADESIWSKI